MKLFNTLTRKKEEFKPICNDKVKMYSCGPTVYSYAHIGNMRAYIFMDSLVRALKYCGYNVINMINITDVGHLMSDGDEGEDKMEKASKEQQKSPYELAKIYSDAFFLDLQRLNITKPTIIEKATDHIKDMIEFVSELIKKDYAYKTEDGIYFDISKFDDYGKLSKQNIESQIAGARVDVNKDKRHPADFALWKKAPKEHIMQWDSPWGMGFPGWHIECSALSRKFLGNRFDIHTGGIDHIPVHHENEIAQSDALEGCSCVNYWLHGEFMLYEGGKMSKSLGNVFTILDLQNKGYSPLDFRYFCLNTHYRKALNFTFCALDGAKTAYERLILLICNHKNAKLNQQTQQIQQFKSSFLSAIEDDINYPLALGILWEMLKQPLNQQIYQAALDFDNCLGLAINQTILDREQKQSNQYSDQIPQDVLDLCLQRHLARKNKDYKASDTLRDQILAKGYTIVDTKEGYTITKS